MFYLVQKIATNVVMCNDLQEKNMFLVESKSAAIVCMLVSLLFLGTWPAILTLLERRGRLPQHTYLDYSITNFLAAVLIALTFGQIGGSTPSMPNFLTQLTQVFNLFFRIENSLNGHELHFSVTPVNP